jgi:hypothetical protein
VGPARKFRFAYAASLGFVAIATLSERDARGTELEAQLEYSAAPGCPGAREFQAVVTGRLGYSPFRADARDRVTVRIEAAGHTLEGRLEWKGDAGGLIGEHAFPSRSRDCGELARAMGFALALQIQLMATTGAESRASAAVPPASVPPVETVAAPPPLPIVKAPQPAITSRDTTSSGPHLAGPSITLGVGAAVGIDVAPTTVAVGRLLGTLEWSHVAVELAAELSGPSATHRADGAGFSQQQLLASLAGCGVRGRWSTCVVAKLGEMRVVGEGIDVRATSFGLVAQAGLRLALTQRLGSRLRVTAHADGLALITQGVVTLDATPVWRTPRLAASFGADLGIRFR